ncbi:RNA polymerase sigma factor [Pseudoalteromonas sp. MMG010]|uniref:RNA polymerase sigma factor n=1 Tax=Pseudoalteromonas sp. MMG010 TaxID=2822685 RepID=UPI001B3A6FB1|nr:RNA polymerase sigma factor [Pseudoalteromonas sp. MMG010]MBQ4832083.1 RNA polymerase sigma factor [Pseudoalteromonas sp. MMG010]
MTNTITQLLPALRRFAYSLTGNQADADDVVQITIEKLLVKGLPDNIEPLKWAFKVCRNVWIDEYRSQKVRQKSVNDPQLHEAASNDEQNNLADTQTLQRVNNALTSLPNEQREIVSLVAVQGMAYKDVASILDIPVGTVMSKLSRARSALYQLIKPDFSKENA